MRQFEFASWLRVDLGECLILWELRFPHLDMAEILPTSLDCWKIKGDIACEMLSRALACVKDSINRVKDLVLV